MNQRLSQADLARTRWQTSSYSGGQGDCVEVAEECLGITPVRDSKHSKGPIIGFGREAWAAFLDALR